MEEVKSLPTRLQNEWNDRNKSTMYDFKEDYLDFQGPSITEFLNVNELMYNQWKFWKKIFEYDTTFIEFKGKSIICGKCAFHGKDYYHVHITFTEVWNKFKDFWQLDTKETQTVFKEMEVLSKELLQEWTDHVYDNIIDNEPIPKLWKTFKKFYKINKNNKCNEDEFKRKRNYVNKIRSEQYDKFYEYCTDSNYHSFDSYTLHQQYHICQMYKKK